MDSLSNPWSVIFVDKFFDLCSIISCIHKLYLSRSRNLDFCIFIYITISMSCNGNWLFPIFNAWLDSFYNDRCTEYSSIQNCTDGTIRAFPHFLQIILWHTRSIRCNCCTFYCYFVLLCCFCGIKCNLIIRLITMFKSKIIIICI